jgi:glc operon protein GlcG
MCRKRVRRNHTLQFRSQETIMRSTIQLTLDDAFKIAETARLAAARKQLEPAIAIVDFGGNLLYLERPDTQSPNSAEIAIKKARTAAFRERPSSALEKRVKDEPGWLMFPNGLPMSGGVPLIFEGRCLGGIGVSGIAVEDEPVAQAGADAIVKGPK